MFNVSLHATLHVPYLHCTAYLPTLEPKRLLSNSSIVRPSVVSMRNLAKYEKKAMEKGEGYHSKKELKLFFQSRLWYCVKNVFKLNESAMDMTYGLQLVLNNSYVFGSVIFMCGILDFALEDVFLSRPDLKRSRLDLNILDLLMEVC
jgi:hypothetical protein